MINSDEEFINEERVFNNDQVYLPSINVLDHVGFDIPTATRFEIRSDPKKRFLIFVNATATNISTNKILSLTRTDIDEINRQALRVRNPEYKNPIGFVLGYFLSKGNEITKKNLKSIKENLAILTDKYPINLEDIIRYARMWISQLL